ncbi:FMN-dependent NADH-azoreductase [Flavobacterium sp. F52]|uniref:FMN-dependent NADH-azoreductase n=1 Tax=Flavobacterium sp. F52 TaxID=1202532 RepID=UPI000272D86E|nr:NAD(P)H-dependent oxidoreductase [Flavobacterium sp. F52]EJG03181.1 NAD(P)H dehydrogenase (quinone) [Flavobacterium sp. F52]
MKNILHVISSPRGSESFSVKLSNAVVEKFTEKFSGSSVTELNLSTDSFPHLDEAMIKAMRTPEDLLSPEQKDLLKRSDDAISQLKEADAIVIGIPLFNFGIPSSLKCWIDSVLRAGHTFSYDENGPKGLLSGKKVYIALATGGVYSEGPAKSYDFVGPYLHAVLGFIGLTDISIIRAEGTAMADLQQNALQKAISAIAI